MKTLFITTDFTNASHNALTYGISMARALGARIVLFHAYQIQVMAGVDTAVAVPEVDTRASVLDRLSQHLRALGDCGVQIDLLTGEGQASRTILQVAKEQQADLIVTGMKVHSKLFRQLFGSTVTDLAKHTKIPLLVVPETANYRMPSRIAVASDIAPDMDAHTLDALTEIGERFQSKVYVVRVIKDRFDEVYELLHRNEKVNRLSRSLDTQYTYAHNKDVAEALGFFIEAEQIDLLALVPHKHTLLEKWFFKSTTKEVIFKSPVPVLVLPERTTATDPAG
ncbi:universal stress protein [Paraflavitalea pollutisoli]|uniref:universal stress protein n=1 Tax=Paraflavitalea pollutisoli TaxID=3034143 RepID=UPI0023EB7048|nr:universal stress protein [Paraflavitalea sp. H1-2-19X]